jgi:hypothetical protein
MATLTISAKEVIDLTEQDSAKADLHNSVHPFNRMMAMLRRKCKGRCSLKRCLEEYCAFRLGVLYFERHFGIGFDDETRAIEALNRVVEMLEEDKRKNEGA